MWVSSILLDRAKLLSRNIHQHRLHGPSVAVFTRPEAPIFTGQKGDNVVVGVGQHIQVVRSYSVRLAHLISVDLPKGMNIELVAVLQILEVGERARVVVRIPHMGRNGGVACPCR